MQRTLILVGLILVAAGLLAGAVISGLWWLLHR